MSIISRRFSGKKLKPSRAGSFLGRPGRPSPQLTIKKQSSFATAARKKSKQGGYRGIVNMLKTHIKKKKR